MFLNFHLIISKWLARLDQNPGSAICVYAVYVHPQNLDVSVSSLIQDMNVAHSLHVVLRYHILNISYSNRTTVGHHQDPVGK